jgi:hypothetical protein
MEGLVLKSCDVCGHPTIAFKPEGMEVNAVICKNCVGGVKKVEVEVDEEYEAEVIPLFPEKNGGHGQDRS